MARRTYEENRSIVERIEADMARGLSADEAAKKLGFTGSNFYLIRARVKRDAKKQSLVVKLPVKKPRKKSSYKAMLVETSPAPMPQDQSFTFTISAPASAVVSFLRQLKG